MALGDSMGANYQFKTIRYDIIDLVDMGHPQWKNNFDMGHHEPGQWTNNTSMGLCLADSLLMKNGKLDLYDLMHRFICWWKGGYNNSFRFSNFQRNSKEINDEIDIVSKSFKYDITNRLPETWVGGSFISGNKSITRNAALPICYHYDIKLACEMARRQSLISYQGIEAKECCSLLSFIIVKIFNGENLKNILENLGSNFMTDVPSVKYLSRSEQEGNDLNRNWNWKSPYYKYSPERTERDPSKIGYYGMDIMAMSLNIVYNTYSFKDALIKAANLRGDSSSVTSVVGQIAGAYYPIETIPGDWIEALYRWDNGEIALRGYMLARLRNLKSYLIGKN